ncbi:hypothetical protein FKP32DRAFT_947743 [Trametes sanguinea]|nr:hypothetical protein FKP32DRAFT_947743 [Trametes sanguinea]
MRHVLRRGHGVQWRAQNGREGGAGCLAVAILTMCTADRLTGFSLSARQDGPGRLYRYVVIRHLRRLRSSRVSE